MGIASIVVLAALIAHPSSAQRVERETAELIPGVTFVGAGAVERQEAPEGVGLVDFWRPVQFDGAGAPVAGRMDCRASAWREPFALSRFDLAGVYAAEEPRYKRGGWLEIDRVENGGGVTRTFDLVGRRDNPQRYVVLTYMAVRSGDDLVSIRRNCTLIRGEGWLRPDYRAMVARYTGFAIDLPPPTAENPLDMPSRERLTDRDS